MGKVNHGKSGMSVCNLAKLKVSRMLLTVLFLVMGGACNRTERTELYKGSCRECYSRSSRELIVTNILREAQSLGVVCTVSRDAASAIEVDFRWGGNVAHLILQRIGTEYNQQTTYMFICSGHQRGEYFAPGVTIGHFEYRLLRAIPCEGYVVSDTRKGVTAPQSTNAVKEEGSQGLDVKQKSE